MKLNNIKSKNSAFTIIEILIVIGIIITLSGIIVLSFEGAQKSSRDSVRIKDVQQIINMLEDYYAKFGKNNYPKIVSSDCLTKVANSKDTTTTWQTLQGQINNANLKGNLPVDPFFDTGKRDTYYYTYCIDDSSCPPEKYVIMARLENKNSTVVEGGYKEKFPSEVNNICDCSKEKEGDAYIYCIKSP